MGYGDRFAMYMTAVGVAVLLMLAALTYVEVSGQEDGHKARCYDLFEAYTYTDDESADETRIRAEMDAERCW